MLLLIFNLRNIVHREVFHILLPYDLSSRLCITETVVDTIAALPLLFPHPVLMLDRYISRFLELLLQRFGQLNRFDRVFMLRKRFELFKDLFFLLKIVLTLLFNLLEVFPAAVIEIIHRAFELFPDLTRLPARYRTDPFPSFHQLLKLFVGTLPLFRLFQLYCTLDNGFFLSIIFIFLLPEKINVFTFLLVE